MKREHIKFLKQKKYIAILLNLSETREVNVKVFVFFTSAEFQVFFKVIHLYKMHFGNMKRLFFINILSRFIGYIKGILIARLQAFH